MRAEREATRRKLDVQLRERDIENKHLTKAGVNNAKQVDLVKVNENTRKNLEQEIAGYKSDAHKQRKVNPHPNPSPHPDQVRAADRDAHAALLLHGARVLHHLLRLLHLPISPLYLPYISPISPRCPCASSLPSASTSSCPST